MQGCFRLFIYVALTVVAAGAIVIFFATRPDIDSADLSEVEPNPAALAELDERLNEIDALMNQSKTTGVATPVQLVITEAELTSKLNAWAGPQGAVAIGDLRTHLLKDTIVLVGTVRIGGFDFRFRGDVKVRIESGERTVEMLRGQVGQLYLPGPVRRGLVGLVARSVDAGVPSPPIDVETLLISEGSLIISGSTRS